MRFFKSSFFIALFSLFYSGFSYSHETSGLCTASNTTVLGHVHNIGASTGSSIPPHCFYTDADDDDDPDACDAGFKPVTFDDGSVACVPESYNAGDIGLDMHGDGHDNFTVNEDDDGNYTVSSDDPDTDINADNSGLNDYPPADSGGPLPYTPPSDPDVTTTTSPPTTSTSSDGSETTTTEQTTTTNNNDNTTTITTKQTTVNNNTGETSVTNTSTTVNNGTGEVSETQTESDSEDTESTASGGSTCNAAPVCDGDAIQCAILNQQYLDRCNDSYESSALDSCGSFECKGDAIQCASLKFQNKQYCDIKEQLDSDLLSSSLADGLNDFIDNYDDPSGTVDSDGFLTSLDADQINVADSLDLGSIISTDSNSGSCPPPETISLSKLNFQVSFQPFCDLATILRPFVLLLFSFMSSVTAYRSLQGTF